MSGYHNNPMRDRHDADVQPDQREHAEEPRGRARGFQRDADFVLEGHARRREELHDDASRRAPTGYGMVTRGSLEMLQRVRRVPPRTSRTRRPRSPAQS